MSKISQAFLSSNFIYSGVVEVVNPYNPLTATTSVWSGTSSSVLQIVDPVNNSNAIPVQLTQLINSGGFTVSMKNDLSGFPLPWFFITPPAVGAYQIYMNFYACGDTSGNGNAFNYTMLYSGDDSTQYATWAHQAEATSNVANCQTSILSSTFQVTSLSSPTELKIKTSVQNPGPAGGQLDIWPNDVSPNNVIYLTIVKVS